jgi:hypothetical protein
MKKKKAQQKNLAGAQNVFVAVRSFKEIMHITTGVLYS